MPVSPLGTNRRDDASDSGDAKVGRVHKIAKYDESSWHIDIDMALDLESTFAWMGWN